jgi:hypothetical protein
VSSVLLWWLIVLVSLLLLRVLFLFQLLSELSMDYWWGATRWRGICLVKSLVQFASSLPPITSSPTANFMSIDTFHGRQLFYGKLLEDSIYFIFYCNSYLLCLNFPWLFLLSWLPSTRLSPTGRWEWEWGAFCDNLRPGWEECCKNCSIALKDIRQHEKYSCGGLSFMFLSRSLPRHYWIVNIQR